MQLNPYLSFDGDCRKAFEFYRQHLGGEIVTMMTWGEGPMAEQADPGIHDRIMHACLQLGDFMLMGGDATNDYPYETIAGIKVVLNVPEPDKAEALFRVLSGGGEVQMPMQETFWAQRFGVLTDRFKVPWMINCGKEGWQ